MDKNYIHTHISLYLFISEIYVLLILGSPFGTCIVWLCLQKLICKIIMQPNVEVITLKNPDKDLKNYRCNPA